MGELRLLLHSGAQLLALPIELGSWMLTDGIRRIAESGAARASTIGMALPPSTVEEVEAIAREIALMLSLLRYICSEEPGIEDTRDSKHRPAFPIRAKNGRLYPPDRPTTWMVGAEIGERLRSAFGHDELGFHASPRAHLRRAHWHGYWVGPKTEEQKFVYRWISPLVVGA